MLIMIKIKKGHLCSSKSPFFSILLISNNMLTLRVMCRAEIRAVMLLLEFQELLKCFGVKQVMVCAGFPLGAERD